MRESTLAHAVLETLEYIISTCFSRILIKISKSSANNIKTSEKDYEEHKLVAELGITEILLTEGYQIIFNQVNRYSQILVSTFSLITYFNLKDNSL
jgi:hypothetical protein